MNPSERTFTGLSFMLNFSAKVNRARTEAFIGLLYYTS